MDYDKITTEYYAQWLGVSPGQMAGQGVAFVFSEERDKRQAGYSKQFDLFAWMRGGLTIISYGSGMTGVIHRIKEKVSSQMTVSSFVSLLREEYGTEPRRGIKFVYAAQDRAGRQHAAGVRKLERTDFPLFYAFFTANNPGAKDTGWLKGYYEDIIGLGFVYGMVLDGKLISVTDLPSMPYMAGQVQEIGINTLKEYRGKGYAKAVCEACIGDLVNNGVCPMWSTGIDNAASEYLAYSLGFQMLAETVIVSLR